MELINWIITLLISSIIIVYILNLFRRKREKVQPPGPPGWLLFGNLFTLGSMPYRTTADLARLYGPVISLKLGSMNIVMILSNKASTELFKNNDLSFVDRSIMESNKSHGFNKSSLALAPYGSYWRGLKKICSVEMFAAKRINESNGIRRKCVNNMLSWIEKEAKYGSGFVHVAKFVFLVSFNLLGNLILSRDMATPESELGSEFFRLMSSLMELGGAPNVSDFFPWLKWFDLQGLRRKLDRDTGKAIHIVMAWVEKRVIDRTTEHESVRRKDFLDVLLDYQGIGNDDQQEKMSKKDITIFILETFLAGSETTSSTIEWALSELLRTPEKMTRVKVELDLVIGKSQKLEESDISNLPYLQAVVKETLRLHPPLPFLIPRKARHDTHFMGYHIPKDTQMFVNAWAIGRDPECWENPDLFDPERFLGSNVDYKGKHFEFIPFGAGRRMCVGLPLADRMLHLVLGSLLHEFDWELEDHVKGATLDMNDQMGIVVRKLQPLQAIPKKSKC